MEPWYYDFGADRVLKAMRRLAVTQTPVKNNQRKLKWKILKE